MTNEEQAIKRLTKSLTKIGIAEKDIPKIIDWFCINVEDQLCGAALLGNYEVGTFWKKNVRKELKGSKVFKKLSKAHVSRSKPASTKVKKNDRFPLPTEVIDKW